MVEKKAENNKKKKSLEVRLKASFKNLFDFSNYDKKTIMFMIFFIFLIIISLGLLYYNYFVDNTFLYLIVVVYFVNPIYELGFLGMLLYLGIMALQAIIVPIPSEILLMASGMIWGVLLGGIMGIIGSMISAILAYYVGKKGGRPLAEKFVKKSVLDTVDDLIKKYGTGFIIISRFLPFIAFDPISYASGVLKIPPKKYILGTLVGLIPRAFFYAYLGASLGIKPPVNIDKMDPAQFGAQVDLFNTVFLIIMLFLIIGFVGYYGLMKYLGKKRTKAKPISNVSDSSESVQTNNNNKNIEELEKS
jgi:uncharacterized membrane protein YdjX (TVP38/TMEM64 family)